MMEKEQDYFECVCGDCGEKFAAKKKKKYCPACSEKRRQRNVQRIKNGVRIVGIAAAAVGAVVLAFKDDDSSEGESPREQDVGANTEGPKYKLQMKYSDGSIEEEDELFDSEEAAIEYGNYMISCAHEGAETLFMSNPGDYPLDEYDEPDYEIIEIN